MKLRHIGQKADLSLSINAIVILILAITMLGLGLAFIRNQFGGATNKLADVLNQIDANQKADLEKSPDRITMTTDTYEIKRGDSKNVYFAIRNNLATTGATSTAVTFDLKTATSGGVTVSGIFCGDAIKPASCTSTNTATCPVLTHVSFQTFDSIAIASGASSVLPLTINVVSNAITTTYSCSITIACPTNTCTGTYFSKPFFVTVTP